MKIELKKIGMLDKAEFEVGNITLICGENNTGKTYATYSLYGYLDFMRKAGFFHFRKVFNEFEKIIKIDEPKIVFDLEKFLVIVNKTIQMLSEDYLKNLSDVFAGKEEDFQTSEFKTDLQANNKELEKIFTIINQSSFFNFRVEIIEEVSEKKVVITLVENFEVEIIERTFIRILQAIYFKKFPNIFILSAERTGASMFQKELDVNKNEIVEKIQKSNGRNIDVYDILLNRASRYPEPVKDNIYFIRELDEVVKKTSFIKKEEKKVALYKEILDLLHCVVGGKYIVTQEGIYFAPEARHRATKGKILVQSASSSVRSLLMLNFYLLHQAQRGDILMIDEPELNLHPKNQILLARLFALLANAGIKIFITTHSDYIVREINNCIMLNNLSDEQIQGLSSKNYSLHHKLNPDSIRAYLAIKDKKSKENVLQRMSINPKQGIYIDTFDDPIDIQNENQGEIFEEVLRNLS
ncbi:AAA family ATPase [Helicobacter pametensis]|uniref:AAA family ATPase n=1 Tax=Helicobacter pametensis TaxID=95149 RepID=UPI0004B9820F|nr:AAA family ATPase [Helicobacter pametensis]